MSSSVNKTGGGGYSPAFLSSQAARSITSNATVIPLTAPYVSSSHLMEKIAAQVHALSMLGEPEKKNQAEQIFLQLRKKLSAWEGHPLGFSAKKMQEAQQLVDVLEKGGVGPLLDLPLGGEDRAVGFIVFRYFFKNDSDKIFQSWKLIDTYQYHPVYQKFALEFIDYLNELEAKEQKRREEKALFQTLYDKIEHLKGYPHGLDALQIAMYEGYVQLDGDDLSPLRLLAMSNRETAMLSCRFFRFAMERSTDPKQLLNRFKLDERNPRLAQKLIECLDELEKEYAETSSGKP